MNDARRSPTLVLLASVVSACVFVAVAPGPALGQGPPASGGETAYYQVVTEKNLFRPLGWSPPDPSPRYALVLTAIVQEAQESTSSPEADFWSSILGAAPDDTAEPSAPDRPNRALIAELGSGRVFYRAVGDKVGELTVASIEEGHVTLEGQEGETTEMRFQKGGGGMAHGMPGPPGGGPPPGGPPRMEGPLMQMGPPPGMPAEWRERMERFRNMSPEEREKMRAQIRAQMGGRGGWRGGGR